METDEIDRALAAKPIKVWLAQHDKTQGDLAEEIGMSEAHLSRVMKGKLRLTGEMLIKLSERTGIKQKDLVRAFVNGGTKGKDAKRKRARVRAVVPEVKKASVGRRERKR